MAKKKGMVRMSTTSNTITENKINFGLKNLYYAKITETVTETGITATYGTPVKLPGAVSISLKKNFEKTAIPADDDPEYATVVDNKGYDVELEITNLPQSFEIDCLGRTVDGDTIVESSDDKIVPCALLFEFDGDVKKKRHVLYRCMATPPDAESSTRGDKADAKNAKLSFSATKAKDTGIIKRTTTKNDGTVYESWFTTVQTSGGTQNS